jgi:hypothetical protein
MQDKIVEAQFQQLGLTGPTTSYANSNLVTSNVQQSVTKNTLSSNRNVQGATKNKQSSISSFPGQNIVNRGSKFTTKWSHMRSKFMECDSFVNASSTVRIEKIAVCATCI